MLKKIIKDEIMESVKQQGQALIDALVQDPNFPKMITLKKI